MTLYNKVIIVSFYEFPERIQRIVSKFENFNTNCFISWDSELTPFSENDKWENLLTKEKLISYYEEESIDPDNFEGSLEDFIVEYNLELESHLIDMNMDLKGVSLILIRT
mgnify:FL=1